MRRSIALILVLIGAAALASPAASHAYERLPRALAVLSPADFASRVRISEAGAETVVLSTVDGYDRERRVKGAHVDDVHLRAVIDRGTGAVVWQVWHTLVTVRGHQDITTVRYGSRAGLQAVRPFQVEHWQGDCPPADGLGMCNRFTRVGIVLPERVVREIAAAYSDRSRTPWRLHYIDASGRSVTSGIAPAEAKGLLLALDAWRKER